METTFEPAPMIRDKHSFFDDGKMYKSRHYIAEVIDVITIEDAKNIQLEYENFFEDCIWGLDEDQIGEIGIEFNPTLYNVWLMHKYCSDFLFAPETDLFVCCKIPGYGDCVWFARTLDGGWFSLDVSNKWLEGRLMPLDFNYKEFFKKHE